MPFSAKKFLTLLFESTSFEDPEPTETVGQHNYYIINGQFGPRWLIPSNPFYGKPALSDWRPYSFFSKLKWKALLSAYSIGVLGKVPGVQAVAVQTCSAIKIPSIDTPLIPVAYVGTPGSQQKLVATLVSTTDGIPYAVMKLPLSDAATDSLSRESVILQQLKKNNFQSAPNLLIEGSGGEPSFQSFVSGRLSCRKLTQAHIDFLLQLPTTGETFVYEDVNRLVGLFDTIPEIRNEHISSAISSIRGGKIPQVLTHGDFAPWNLKLQSNGTIFAIDWEDADWNGLPLWDLCHYFLVQAHLFNEKGPLQRLLNHRLVRQYISLIGISDEEALSLVKLYCLMKAGGLGGSCDKSYRNFLISLTPELMTT